MWTACIAAACIAKVEGALAALPGVDHARANLTQGRVRIRWRDAGARQSRHRNRTARVWVPANASSPPCAPPATTPPILVPESLPVRTAAEEREMVRCMAVAGFAAANVMLLSLSIWTGHAEGMAAETRSLFHWFSALIALPALAWAGRPFFRSALKALRAGRTNMDVPISLAVTLAAGDQPVGDGPRRAARLFRFGDRPAVLPADRALSRPARPAPGAVRRGAADRAAGWLRNGDRRGRAAQPDARCGALRRI